MRAFVYALRVTIAPLLASRAATFLQRVVTPRRDIEYSPPRCVDLRDREPQVLSKHAHTSSTSRASRRDRHFNLPRARLYVLQSVETRVVVVDVVGTATGHT